MHISRSNQHSKSSTGDSKLNNSQGDTFSPDGNYIHISMSTTAILRQNPVFSTALLLILAFLGYLASQFLGILVMTVFLYYCVRPLYHRLENRKNHPSLIAIVSVLTFIIPILALVSYTVLIAFQEMYIYSSDLTRLFDTHILGIDPYQFISETDVTEASAMLQTAYDYIGVAGEFVMHLVVILSVVFILLRDGEKLRNWFLAVFDTDANILEEYLRRVDHDLKNVFFGNLLHAIVIALFSALIYNALNTISPPGLIVPFPTLAGILTGVSSMIPVIGLKLVYLPLGGYLTYHASQLTVAEVWWFPALYFAIVITVIDGFSDLFIRSYVSGRTVHVTLLIVAYITGALLFGWYGVFFGPIVMMVIYHFLTYLVPEYFCQGDTAQTRLNAYME